MKNLLDYVENGDSCRQFWQKITFVDQILVVNEDASKIVGKDKLRQILPTILHVGCTKKSAVYAWFAFPLKIDEII